MPIAAAVPAIIGGVGSVIGGVVGSRAANNAAQTQQQAANAAAGQVQAAGTEASETVARATGDAVGGVNAATGQAIANANAANEQAQAQVQGGANAANETLLGVRDAQLSNLSPYQQAGGTALTRLSDMTNPGGSLDRDFSFGAGDFQADPGYQFALSEGQRAIERGAAARGMVGSGGTLKALSRYSTGYAAQTYNDAYSRAADSFKINRDSRLAQAGILRDLTGVGERATAGANEAQEQFGAQVSQNQVNTGTTLADLTTGNARYTGNTGVAGATTAGQLTLSGLSTAAGLRLRGFEGAADYSTSGAAARAAGQIGAGNAWRGTIAGVTNAAMDGANAVRGGRRKPKAARTAPAPPSNPLTAYGAP